MVYNIKDIVCYKGVVFLEAMELAVKSAEILDAKKAADIEILNISELTSIADYFVICTGSSTTQVKALADNVVEMLKEECGTEPLRLEGYKSCQWIWIDYGSVVIHVLKMTCAIFILWIVFGETRRSYHINNKECTPI